MSQKPLVTNPNDEKQVKAAEERAKVREQIRAQAWRALLETADGRQILKEILNVARVGEGVADVESPNRTYFMLGEQNVGHWVRDQITLFHKDALWQMEREEAKRMEVIE